MFRRGGPDIVQQENISQADHKTIKDIVGQARTIIGIGPITSSEIEESDGTSLNEKLVTAIF